MSALQDLRYAMRLLWKDRAFALVTVALIAAAIGANTAIFSFANALFWKPVDAPHSDRLMRVLIKSRAGTREGEFSYPEYLALRNHATGFESLAAEYPTAPLNVVADHDAREHNGAVVSANYFSLLGIKPAAGRFFRSDEDAVPDRDPVAVISARLLRSRFAGEPSTLGREITINGVAFRVIGIAPESFYGDEPGVAADLWIPTAMLRVGYRWCDAYAEMDCTTLHLLGRMAPGRTPASAEAEINSIAATELYPAVNNGQHLALAHATGESPEHLVEIAPQVRLLMAIGAMLLLIACANVAGLLLARGVARRRELAIRLALGAHPRRVIRQLLTENLVLAGLGAVAGLLLASWIRPALVSFYTLNSEGGQGFYDVSLDWRVALFCAAVAVATGLLFGLAPAVSSAREGSAGDLKCGSGMTAAHPNRLRDGLVACQIALSLVLLVLAGLMARSASNLLAAANFDPSHVVILRLRPRLMKYTPAEAEAFYQQVTQQLPAVPVVQSLGYGTGGAGLLWSATAGIPTRLGDPPSPEAMLRVLPVNAAYFATLRIPLLQGRVFDDRDRPDGARVVVVNQSAALRYWPHAAAVGQVLVLDGVRCQVVGVVADIGLRSAGLAAAPHAYSDFWQSAPGQQGDMRMVVRVRGDAGAALAAVRRVIGAIDPRVPIDEDMPLADQVKSQYATLWLARSVAGWLGGMALLLSAVGLYSVLAFAVRSRTREIGLRVAVGAQPSDVIADMLRRGMWLCGAGILAGLLLAAAGARLVAGLLYGVPPFDLLSFALAVAAVAVMALVTSYLPARQAARIDPMVALRQE